MLDDSTDLIERVAAELRNPVRIDPALDIRVMAAVRRQQAEPRPEKGLLRWLVRPVTLRVSPIVGLAAAAALAALVILPRSTQSPPTSPTVIETGVRSIRFLLSAPEARSVSLVGDFNDWEKGATPLAESGAQGVWTVDLDLPPGRYQYTFVIDGDRWVADPTAPRVAASDFGPPSSVITVPEI